MTEGCVPCRTCGGDQRRGWHQHDSAENDADTLAGIAQDVLEEYMKLGTSGRYLTDYGVSPGDLANMIAARVFPPEGGLPPQLDHDSYTAAEQRIWFEGYKAGQACNPASEPLNPPSEGVTPDNPSKALTEAARPDSEGAGHGWWNYRVTKRGSDPEQGLDYEIREVYYRQDGSILGWTEKPCEPYGHSEAGLREDFQLMQEAFERPVLDLDEEEAKRETLPDCEGWVCQSCGADNFIPPGFERAFPPGQTEGGDRAAQ